MEYENTVNAEYEEVVNPQETSLDEDAEQVVDAQKTDNDTVEGAENQESAEEVAKPHQSREENQRYAEMRRANEQLEKQYKTSQEESNGLLESLKALGYQGNSMKEITEEINAQNLGVSIEEYRNSEEAKRIEREQIINNSPEIKEARKIIQENVFKNDIEAIKEAYPDADITDVMSIGETYLKCRQSGIDAVASYSAQLSVNNRDKKPTPPSIGRVEKTPPKKEFFTEEELNNLTEKDLNDEKTLMMALKSLEQH